MSAEASPSKPKQRTKAGTEVHEKSKGSMTDNGPRVGEVWEIAFLLPALAVFFFTAKI
ncbi:MAG: hypothetical protein WKG06_10640 [Segetibacter sp.]